MEYCSNVKNTRQDLYECLKNPYLSPFKMNKLNIFLQKAKERDPLLVKQFDYMCKYSDILKERMQAWK